MLAGGVRAGGGEAGYSGGLTIPRGGGGRRDRRRAARRPFACFAPLRRGCAFAAAAVDPDAAAAVGDDAGVLRGGAAASACAA